MTWFVLASALWAFSLILISPLECQAVSGNDIKFCMSSIDFATGFCIANDERFLILPKCTIFEELSASSWFSTVAKSIVDEH